MKNQFVYSVILVMIVFVFTRLPYFLYYPVTVISFDTASYISVALNIIDGNLPLFEIRTPGYPVFLTFVLLFSKNPVCISLLQSLFTLFTSIFFLRVVNKTFKSFTFLFAISISIFISSSIYIFLETALLSESIYVNFLILSCSFLILALKENRISYLILLSFSIGVAIIIRPAGLFLVCIPALLTIYFIIQKYKFKLYVSLILPFLVVLISLCTYNYFTLKTFSLTVFGAGASLSGATILVMEPCAEYPEFVNSAIDSTLNGISEKDINYVKNGMELGKLYRVFNDNLWNSVYLINHLMKEDLGLTYPDVQPIIKKISVDAVRNYPLVYAKFVLSNFYQFFMNIRKPFDLYTSYTNAYKGTIIERKHLKILEKGIWCQVSSNKKDYERVISFYSNEINSRANIENVVVIDSNNVELKPTLLQSASQSFEKIHNLFFRNIIWLVMFGLVFSISILKLFKSKFSDVDALIYFFLGVMYISNALFVSIVQSSIERYSYTIEFVVFLSLPFLFILVRTKGGESD